MELDNAEKWKHEQIYEHVHAAILRGEYGPGDRVPTDMQLMRKFKTSRPTVARAMRDLEAAGLLQRRRGAPSVVKGAPKLQTRPLGLLVPSLDKMGIFGPLGAEITRLAHVDGFHLVWFDTAGPSEADAAESMRQFCRHCVVQKFAGVFFAPAELMPGMEAVNCQAAETLDEAGIALVLLDRDLTAFPERSRFDVVGVDNFRVGFMQTDHLLERGCRHIEHVARPLSAPTVDARTEGYRWALRRHGLSCRESWVRRGDPADKEFLKEVTSRLPEAFVCANDWTAARSVAGPAGAWHPRATGRAAGGCGRRHLCPPAIHATDDGPPAQPGDRCRGRAGHDRADRGPQPAAPRHPAGLHAGDPRVERGKVT